MANFWLTPSQSPYLKIESKKYDKALIRSLENAKDELDKQLEHLCTVDVSVSILGIRNLISKALVPHLELKITNSEQVETITLTDDYKKFISQIERENSQDKTNNPNFATILTFKKIKLVR